MKQGGDHGPASHMDYAQVGKSLLMKDGSSNPRAVGRSGISISCKGEKQLLKQSGSTIRIDSEAQIEREREIVGTQLGNQDVV